MLTIIYDASIDTSLNNLLEKLDVTRWTRLSDAQGDGEAGLKVNTPVWPGHNNVLLVAGEEKAMRSLAASIRDMQADFKLSPGVFMTLHDIEEI